jgi:serine/threonine protein phosphatase PrpC
MQGDGKGDGEFFARRIVDTHITKIDDIEKIQELIKNLARIYGDNSARISALLTCAIANARNNIDKFTDSAQENLNNKVYGKEDVWRLLADNTAQWDEKQKQQPQPSGRAVPEPLRPQQPEPPDKPEPPTPAKELHPLVADAGDASEKDMNKAVPNQDARFADPEHGAFGVFDGLGSYKKSGDVANTAAASISEALARIDPQLPLDEAQEQVRKALTDVSEELSKEENVRFRDVVDDIKKNAEGTLSDDDFDEKYEGPKRQQSVSEWIRGHFDLAKPDDINQHLKGWIKKQVQGMTTASVVKVWQGQQGERKAIIANAGDSRVYHYTARDGKVRIVTVDNNSLYDIVGEVKARQIQDTEASSIKGWKEVKNILGSETTILKRSDPQHLMVWEGHVSKNSEFGNKYQWNGKGEAEVPLIELDDFSLTKFMLMANLEPKSQTIDIEPQDKLMIVSDGVYNYTLTHEIEQIVRDPTNKEAGKAAEALVKFAKRGERNSGVKSGSLQDDTTAVVVDIK